MLGNGPLVGVGRVRRSNARDGSGLEVDPRLGTLLEGPLLSHYHLGHCFFGHVPHRPVARYPAFRRDRELLKPPAPALSQRALPLLRQSQELHRVPLAALSLTV